MQTVKPYLVLCRMPIAVFASASAFTGAALASPRHFAPALPAVAAVLLLSCGASALNQYQERDLDALMERTRRRPLPSGTLSPGKALTLSLLLMAAGLGSAAFCGQVPFVLAALAPLWYNGLYTPLKRRTAFAAVYGAPVGMLPPAIGWTAAGGGLSDPRLFAVAMLFFLWQVPHFWYLLLDSDDYARAGLPSLSAVLPRPRIARVAAFWTVSAAAAALLLPLYGIVGSAPARAALVASALLLVLTASVPAPGPSFRFRIINTFIVAVMAIISADALLVR